MLKNIVQKMTFSKRIAAVRNSSTQFPPNAENCAQGPNLSAQGSCSAAFVFIQIFLLLFLFLRYTFGGALKPYRFFQIVWKSFSNG